MLEISNVEVYDLKQCVIASGNAMRLEPAEYTDEEFKRGLIRMKKLIHASNSTEVHCHDNALTGIRVSFDVKYPQYWTPEFQRYHFADIVTSSSKMHRLLKMDMDKSCNIYVSEATIQEMQQKIDNYNWAEDHPELNKLVFTDRHGKSITLTSHQDILYNAWMQVISNCPMGLELFMRVSTNYKQLQTIYYQRLHHRLKEDWGNFIEMIKQLPYFEELILGK